MWATIEQLEEHLGLPQDARMVECLDASTAWCQRQRPDLHKGTTPPADVQHAVVIYAGLLYRERANAQGFATYEQMDIGGVDNGAAMANVFRLLGHRKPVAR